MKITFKKLVVEKRFHTDYENWSINNELDFENKNFVCVYAPNGVGKSSLAKALKEETESQYEYMCDENSYTQTSKEKPVIVINDFFLRNIASRDDERLSDYILGSQIAKEMELREKIEFNSNKIKNHIKAILKSTYGIKTKETMLWEYAQNKPLRGFVAALANVRDQGKNYDAKKILELKEELLLNKSEIYSEEEMSYVRLRTGEKENILTKIIKFNFTKINEVKDFQKLDISNDAIEILNKYTEIKKCIFEESHVLPENIRETLEKNKKYILSQLTKEEKDIAIEILKEDKNPLKIKEIFNIAFETGDVSKISELIEKIKGIIYQIENEIINEFTKIVEETGLEKLVSELNVLIKNKIELTEEDELLLQNIVENCINRKVVFDRDENKNIIFKIGQNDMIGKTRQELPLSTGEQNFLSLYFELLAAKNSKKEIVIIDDPISSFDSIYKNKIIYAIIKVLSCKKTIILTHNIDTIKLMQHQYRNSFILYLMKNKDNENGFIKINKRKNDNTDIPEDLDLILEIKNVISLFEKEEWKESIKNKEQFLISVVPFMRSYTNLISNETQNYKKLCKIMHGYENESIDINEIYKDLFAIDILPEGYVINVNDILLVNIVDEIVDKTKYPLLNRTLYHTLNYLKLRLMVENTLYNTDKTKIDISKNNMQLHQIIETYLSKNIELKTKLLSKKTLLNEFNHFEHDMCIFMPALDISDNKLEEEKAIIIEMCNKIKAEGL